jgi:hypothetical protein
MPAPYESRLGVCWRARDRLAAFALQAEGSAPVFKGVSRASSRSKAWAYPSASFGTNVGSSRHSRTVLIASAIASSTVMLMSAHFP